VDCNQKGEIVQSVAMLAETGVRFRLMIYYGFVDSGFEVQSPEKVVSLGKQLIPKTENISSYLGDFDWIILSPGFMNNQYNDILTKYDLWDRTIVIDYLDEPAIDSKLLSKAKAYFKRSWLTGTNKRPQKEKPKLFPFPFCALPEYFKVVDQYNPERDVPILFTKPIRMLGQVYGRRMNVLHELANIDIPRSKIDHGTSGSLNHITYPTRANPWVQYMKDMQHAQVIFTAVPSIYDGDNRTWEAMTSGAVVVMDVNHFPIDAPKNNRHVIMYNAGNKKSIRRAIRIVKGLLEVPETIKTIGKNGLEWTQTYHMPVNRVQYLLKQLELA